MCVVWAPPDRRSLWDMDVNEGNEVTEPFDRQGLAELLAVQDGVVARRQLVELHAKRHEIRRLLRRRELVVVTRVSTSTTPVHSAGSSGRGPQSWPTGQPPWPANPLFPPRGFRPHPRRRRRTAHGPPLAGRGRPSHRGTGRPGPLEPVSARIRLEHAIVDVAGDRGDVVARFRVLADAVQSRATTPERIAIVLRRRRGIAHKRLLLELLEDLAQGASSVLEREYLVLERSHGLPTTRCGAARQKVVESRDLTRYRDVDYEEYGVVVELDGLAFHDSAAARDRDAARDLDHAITAAGVTVRLTYGQVFRDGCRTIAKVATLLQRRGWQGELRPCPYCADS